MRPKDVGGWPHPEFIAETNDPGPTRDAAVVLATVVQAAERWVADGNSHSALSNRAQVPRTTWNSIRDGTTWPQLDTFVPLAQAVGVDVVSLPQSTADRAPEGYGAPIEPKCQECLEYLRNEGIDTYEDAAVYDLAAAASATHGFNWDVRCTAVERLRDLGWTPEEASRV